MSVNIQHKLQEYEMTPPADAWKNIAERLDREFDTAEIHASEKITKAELKPPAGIFEKIMLDLQQPVTPSKETPVVGLRSKKWLAAAVAVGILLGGAWLYQRFAKKENLNNSAALTKPTTDTANETGLSSSELLNPAEMQAAVAQLVPKKIRVHNNRAFTPSYTSYRIENYTKPGYQTDPDFRAHSPAAIKVVDATGEVVVKAPPIRDAQGRIIMDMNLLTDASGNYITVTGPNGEQTRISVKFARFLAYLNSNADEQDQYLDFLFRQSSTWKKRFEEWRKKILEQANFAPSDATFFDILELKELIDDY
jgi:hypothetical protein